ncbi:MAG: EAL domain-containing protein [Magnetococcales bacterium]|nr:EAL domain-containing protein [Magnetococcales bacterium]
MNLTNKLPWLVLIIGLLATWSLQRDAARNAHRDLGRQFDYHSREIVIRVTQRMETHEQILRGVSGLFAASVSVERDEFYQYVSALQLKDNYPGIQGVGFAKVVVPQEKEQHIEALRRQGFADYTIRPTGERELYTSIIYLEPFTGRNLRAFGFDMYSEATRRQAMERARDTGNAALSGRVTLVQEDGQQPQSGVLIYLPVYRNGSPHDTVAERRANIVGWAYAPFRMNDLMAGILGEQDTDIDLEIFDGDRLVAEKILYDSDNQLSASQSNVSPYQNDSRIDIAGHSWTLRVRSLPTFESRLDTTRIYLTKVVGWTMASLLTWVVWLLVNGRERAVQQAHIMLRELKATEENAHRSETMTQAVLQSVINGIVIINANKEIVVFNPAAERLFGYTAAEAIGQDIRLLMPAIYRDQHNAGMDRYFATGERKIIGRSCEIVGLRKDGSQFPGEVFISEITSTDNPLFVGILTDISERKQAEQQLRLFHKVFENAGEAILVTDAHGRISDANPAYERITGYSRQEALGKSPSITKSGRHSPEFYRAMWNDLLVMGHWQGEIWDRRKNGEIFPKWLSISAIRSHTGDLSHYVAIFLDISDRKESEQKLEQLAFYDALTGLPNRLFFHNRLSHEIAQALRHHNQLALMFIDLDRFKWVNDTLGHTAGDDLLKEIGSRLQRCIREEDIVARLGGDEFTIILTHVTHADYAASVAQKLIAAVREPVVLLGQEVHVGASVGIALFPQDATDIDALTKQADRAMYQAKSAGRNTFRFVSAQAQDGAIDHITMENNLHKALERQELLLLYQPKLSLADNRLHGAEALVRWRQSDGTMINPAQFIPLAEETGLIVPIGRWVLETACRWAADWNRSSEQPVTIAVNVSAREFQQPDLVEHVYNTLESTGLSPTHLELEITESMVIGNVDKAIGIMKCLRNIGISLAMDDFGTGYSALGYLKRFPLTTLKIDRSFVQDLPGCQGDGAIVNAILSMAHGLKLRVVAEGVETDGQLQYLRQQQCAMIQGYLVGKPMPAEQLVALLQSTRWGHWAPIIPDDLSV